MGLINYEQLEDGFDASANLWNERFGVIFKEINGNLDSANLKNGAVTTAKIATGAVTSDKLGFQQYLDDNGWLVTDLGLVKLATKHRTFKVPSYPVDGGGYVTFDTGMALNPVGFNENAAYNVIHQPYMTNLTNQASGNWSLMPKDENNQGKLRPNSQVAASRIRGGKSQANEPGAVDTWVIF